MIARLADWTILVVVVSGLAMALWHWADVARDVYVERYGRR